MSTQLTTVRQSLQGQEELLRAIIPANTIDYGRFMARAMQQMERFPDADPKSMVLAIVQCAALGLELGVQAHLVPFQGKIQLIADYKGVIAIAVRSGAIRGAEGRIICQNDHYEWEEGNNPRLVHRPALTNQGPRIATYVRFQMPDGSYRFEVMRESELAQIRKKSLAKSGPWFDFEDEMAKAKTAKRGLKWMQGASIDARELNYLQAFDDVQQKAAKKVLLTDKDGKEIAIELPEEQPATRLLNAEKKSFYTWYTSAKQGLSEDQRKEAKADYESATTPEDIHALQQKVQEWITFNQDAQNENS